MIKITSLISETIHLKISIPSTQSGMGMWDWTTAKTSRKTEMNTYWLESAFPVPEPVFL